jgi:putative molybdopterin biosynthesis protein
VSAGLLTTAPLAHPAPPIVGGSYDLLLEWALRESGSGLATLPEGSESGLRRLAHGDVMAAAIHLHRIEGDDDGANADAVANAPGLHDVVLIAFARREQGLIVAPGNPLKLSDIASAATARARMALRPNGAGAQLLLLALLSRTGVAFEALNTLKPPCPTDPDVAQAVRVGRADCGIAARAVALTAGLDFIPLTWEHFDLALRQRDYFLPGPQALVDFLRTAAFRERAAELKGYDVAGTGSVRHIN